MDGEAVGPTEKNVWILALIDGLSLAKLTPQDASQVSVVHIYIAYRANRERFRERFEGVPG